MTDLGYKPITDKDLGDESGFHTLDYDKPHVYVCTPAYDGKVDSGYAQCMGNTGWHMGLFGIRMTASAMGNSAFIEMGRNLFVKFLLEDENLKSCTHLFFVDSDLEWDSAAFLGLVTACNEDRPVVAGVYPRRQKEPWDFPAVWTPHPDIKGPDGEDTLWVDDDGWLKCDRVPTGFLCIRRNVLEEMSKDVMQARTYDYGNIPWVFHTKFDKDNRFVGEDYGFCDLYREKYNRPIDVWMGFEFTHGGFTGCYEEFLAAKVGAEKKQKEHQTSKGRTLGGKRHAKG